MENNPDSVKAVINMQVQHFPIDILTDIPGVEATKIISHQRKAERWPLNICSRTLVASRHRLVVYIFGGNDLLQKPYINDVSIFGASKDSFLISATGGYKLGE
jgi:hypothetical protein